MNSRKVTSLSLAFMAAGATLPATVSAAAKENPEENTKKKNVLMIAIDDLKPLLGCYGDPVAKTPNFDRLAREGVVFSHAYCQEAISAATRASLLTGWIPDRTKVWDLQTLIRDINPDVVTLPQYFKNNGYMSTGMGKIYDFRSVDKHADAISWSKSYFKQRDYLHPDFENPVGYNYQSEEAHALCKKTKEEWIKNGTYNQKTFYRDFQKVYKPSTECLDVPDNAYADGAVADGAVHFLQTYNEDQPFFLAVGFLKPHLPFVAPEKYWKMYNREDIPLAEFRRKAENSPELAYHNCGELMSYTDIPPLASFTDVENCVLPDEKARELIHGYYACVSYTDAQIGKVLDALEASGKKDETIIVLWGDHGWHLGDHGLWNKHSNFENATRVPMMIVNPGSKPAVIDDPVEFLSIYPTLCDLAGIERNEGLDGVSVAEIVKGEKPSEVKEYAVSQYPRSKAMGYSIRSERYRYTVWVKWGRKHADLTQVVAEELYDYDKDPNETVNVVDQKSYRKALKQMRGYWEDYKETRSIPVKF